MSSEGKLFTRLVYLLHTRNNITIPDILMRYLKGGSWLKVATQENPVAADVNMDIYYAMIEEGKKGGKGNSKEAVDIVQKLIDTNLRTETKLSVSQRIKIYSQLEILQHTVGEEFMEIDLSDPGNISPISKFDTGFQPFDAVIGGFYQGIFLLMGPPTSGKTSLMISMMETLRKSGYDGSLLFLQNEIPGNMMHGRLSGIFRRTTFNKGDIMPCGPRNSKYLLHYVKENPDPKRIILYDGPDVIVGQDNNSFGAKAYIAEEYHNLIELKSHCRAVIVSGWPNRKETQVTHFNQVGDAIEKARYADAIIGINKMAQRVQLKCLKNRFGPPDTDLTFEFNYEDLTWKPGSVETEIDFWTALEEDQVAEDQAQAETNGRA